MTRPAPRATNSRRDMPVVGCFTSHDFPDRQLAEALPRGREDRVADGRRDRWRARLADAALGIARRHDVHLDLGHLGHPEHPVVVEVALLHAALVDRDLAPQRGGATSTT